MWLSIAHKPRDWRYADFLISEDQVDRTRWILGGIHGRKICYLNMRKI